VSEIQKTEAEVIASLVHKPFVQVIEGVPYFFIQNENGAWFCEDKRSLLPAPVRKYGSTNVHEVDSFVKFCKIHGSLANAMIYLDVNYLTQAIKATAVFNDHVADKTGWRDHTAVFVPRKSAEWERWNNYNGKAQSQEEFATFLVSIIGDITSPAGSKLPTGSDVLTFVSQLQETRTVKYGSAINLQNGTVQLEFTEDGDKGTKGKLEVFKEFALGIKPFFGGDAYELRAFLRYRIDRNNGAIKFWFDLQRPDRVLEDAAKELINKINTETGLPVIYGTP